MARHIVISGCSGGGKSTLLAELARRGHNTVPEPGRRAISDGYFPWEDIEAFVCRCLDLAQQDYASQTGLTFYDRSGLDALIWFDRSGAPLPDRYAGLSAHLHYDPCIFMAPPWPDIYVQDAERRHDYRDAVAEYNGLCDALPHYGYDMVEIPKASVAQRADWIETRIDGNTTD